MRYGRFCTISRLLYCNRLRLLHCRFLCREIVAMFRKKKTYNQKIIDMLKGLAAEANVTADQIEIESHNWTVKSSRRFGLGLQSAHWDGRAKAYEHLIETLEKEV